MPLRPPYPFIRTALRKGAVIPFLGAGASFGARDPGAVKWRNAAAQIAYLPTASELAECLAEEVNFPEEDRKSSELTKVSQYYDAVNGRDVLEQKLREIFGFEQAPGRIHECLAAFAAEKPMLIVTTNYDDLIERAFCKAELPLDVVVHSPYSDHRTEVLWWQHGKAEAKGLLAKDLYLDLPKVSVLYKIHGAIDRAAGKNGQFVITEDDYIDFLTRMSKSAAIPNIFAEPFQSRHFLFLGYGLYDWNLRVVLNRIDRDLRRPAGIRSWAIEARPKALEKMLWQQRNVNVFDGISMDEFVADLTPAQAQAGGG